MNRTEAAIGSAAFFVVAPGTIAGLIPWLITHWRIQEGASQSLSVAGVALLIPSLALLIECFARFAYQGLGTPAPVAPPQHLVITGAYRFVRNPMYVAVLGLIFGQMLLFGNAALLAYGVAMWMAFYLFVYFYEEPTLRTQFPEEYAAYAKAVPRWLPRITPWKPD
jgi:protein-S-isoprenylcysteine O-methyltransferase Ste14